MKALLGQNEPISMVLVSGIVISLVSAAYFWGMPIINKNIASTDFNAMNNELKGIADNVVSLSNSGGGKVEIDLQKPVSFIPFFKADNDNNTFTVTAQSQQPVIYSSGSGSSMLYVGTISFSDMNEYSGVFGQSSPGIVTFTQAATDTGSFLMKSKLRVRPLYTTSYPPKVYSIRLCGDDDLQNCNRAYSGNTKLTLSFKGTETVREASGDVVVTTIGVRLV